MAGSRLSKHLHWLETYRPVTQNSIIGDVLRKKERKEAKQQLSGKPTDPLILVCSAMANITAAWESVEKGVIPDGLAQAVTGLNGEVLKLLMVMSQKGIQTSTLDRQIMEVRQAA